MVHIPYEEIAHANSNAKVRTGPPPYEYHPPHYSPVEKAIGAALFLPTLAVFAPFALGIYVATTLFRESDESRIYGRR